MQLSQVNTEYGAPMGRTGRDITNAGPVKMHLELVPLDSGGYDKGGAYWGLRFPVKRMIRSTPRIYRYYWRGNCTQSTRPIIEGFIDAFDRDDAKAQVLVEYPQATFYK